MLYKPYVIAGRRRMKKLIIAAVLMAVCVLAYADTIHFVDGTKLKGKIVKETKDMVVLDTGKEKIPIQKSVISITPSGPIRAPSMAIQCSTYIP